MSAPQPFTEALVPTISLEALLARREALRASVVAVQTAYAEMHARRRALFDGDSSGDETDSDLALEWRQTRREISIGRVRDGRRKSPDEDDGGLDEAFKRIDAACWGHMMGASGLEQLMDQKRRAEWRKQLDELTMPEFTYENVAATFTTLAAQRGDIFEDGVVNVFRGLSFDYHTNTPVKLGKRLIIKYACEAHTWRYNDKHERAGQSYVQVYGPSHSFADKLDDLLRAFCVLEGKPEMPRDRGAYAMLCAGGWMKENEIPPGELANKRDFELHGYLKFRGFKNRNAHVTFLRPDLIDQLNKIIAKRFPNALPATRESA